MTYKEDTLAECYNVVIWGMGEQYDSYVNQIKFEELKGNICVKGIVAENNDWSIDTFDGYEVISKDELRKLEVSCVIVTNTEFYYEPAKYEILSILPEVKVISAKVFNIPQFDFGRYYKIVINRPTIIANNCWGGLTYNSLYMEFLSPFINLTILPNDYIRLLSNIRGYLKEELVMVKDRNMQGNPIGRLADIEINFVHYKNFVEAKECWEKRVKRVNYDNLFVYMWITDKYIANEFQKLTIEKKYGFCDFKNNNNLNYIESFEKQSEVRRNFGGRSFASYMNDQARRRLYDYDDTMGNRGAKTIKVYDVLKLLSGEEEFIR